ALDGRAPPHARGGPGRRGRVAQEAGRRRCAASPRDAADERRRRSVLWIGARFRRAAAVILAVRIAAFAGAATGVAEKPRDAGVAEKVSVHLVQMPILATDRQGRGIPDLRADEIVVEHRGEKMKVAYLESA